METKKLYSIVKHFFGYKGEMNSIDIEGGEVSCVLYNAFLLKCDVDKQYGAFGIGIVLGDGRQFLTEFLGKECSLNNDEKSIKESLQIVDEYCRMRLPDKFLQAYDEAYKGK